MIKNRYIGEKKCVLSNYNLQTEKCVSNLNRFLIKTKQKEKCGLIRNQISGLSNYNLQTTKIMSLPIFLRETSVLLQIGPNRQLAKWLNQSMVDGN